MPEGASSASGWLTTAEVAERLRVNQRTVQRWVASGQLRATKAGPKVWRIREQDLQAFLVTSQNAGEDRGV